MKELELTEIMVQIAEIAQRHNISAAHLCRHARIAGSSYSRWKNGQASPTIDSINTLIRALNSLTA